LFLYYCLANQQNNWNFLDFVVLAKSIGTNHIKFINYKNINTKKYDKEVAYNRFKNIVIPICELTNLSYEVHDYDAALEELSNKKLLAVGHNYVTKFFEKNKYIWKLKSNPTKEDYITVTIRSSFRKLHRNSSSAWYQFIEYCAKKKIFVKVFEDKEINPISIKLRWEIYSKAKMNYGVTNGPLALCVYSDAPYKIWIKSEIEQKDFFYSGFDSKNFPFAVNNQSLIWKEDTRENLIKYNLNN